ncbi:MAG: hypothetical protein ACKVIB_00740 [Pseudomonadales bacterium]
MSKSERGTSARLLTMKDSSKSIRSAFFVSSVRLVFLSGPSGLSYLVRSIRF